MFYNISEIAPYFNLNNNEISKELLVNKFNTILDNQVRIMPSYQKIPLPNEPQRSLWFVQKQPPDLFCKKNVLKKFTNFTGKHLCWSFFFIKACNFIKKKLQQWRFPVKFVTFLRTSILKNIHKKLLLFVSLQNTLANSSREFVLDEALTVSKVSIFLSLTILFDQMQPYHFYVSLTFQLTCLLNF